MKFLSAVSAAPQALVACAQILWRAIITHGPIVWVRNLFYVVRMYREDLTMIANAVDDCRKQVITVERYVKRVTKVHVDVATSSKDFTRVIVIGSYRGKDHVQVFHTRPGSIDMLIEQLQDMQRYATVERIDTTFEIDATMKRSLLI